MNSKNAKGLSTAADAALLALIEILRERNYHFVTPTPATHERVLARSRGEAAGDLRDVFGWSMPFGPGDLDPAVLKTLIAAEAMERLDDGRFKSKYRVSSLQETLFLHSAYPTDRRDSVFFGPDSYRFADLIASELADGPPRPQVRIVDIGAGAGVGAIVAARLCPDARITMTDINGEALRLASLNARAAGVEADVAQGQNLEPVHGSIDVALANPPYMQDTSGRDYRDGGDMHGGRVALDMANEALDRMSPGGRLILYTGSAIVEGKDRLHDALAALAARNSCILRYREIDPDVFGEELENDAYHDVERIAVVGAVISKPG